MIKILSIGLIATSIFLSGCGDPSFDPNDPNTLIEMMDGMSLQEQTSFIADAQLVSNALGGEYRLDGMTVEDIKAEAKHAREFLQEKNIKFLTSYIDEMEKNGIKSTRLHINSNGVISRIKPGFVYNKEYSIANLKERLAALQSSDASDKFNADGSPRLEK